MNERKLCRHVICNSRRDAHFAGGRYWDRRKCQYVCVGGCGVDTLLQHPSDNDPTDVDSQAAPQWRSKFVKCVSLPMSVQYLLAERFGVLYLLGARVTTDDPVFKQLLYKMPLGEHFFKGIRGERFVLSIKDTSRLNIPLNGVEFSIRLESETSAMYQVLFAGYLSSFKMREAPL